MINPIPPISQHTNIPVNICRIRKEFSYTSINPFGHLVHTVSPILAKYRTAQYIEF